MGAKADLPIGGPTLGGGAKATSQKVPHIGPRGRGGGGGEDILSIRICIYLSIMCGGKATHIQR